MKFKRVLFDIETNGLLPDHIRAPFCMDRIHSIGIKCLDSEETVSFANNKAGNNIANGVTILQNAEFITGHNIVDFDIEAIKLIYPQFEPRGRLYDTLVMSRMVFADIKEKDFRSVAAGKLEGKYIGLHGLEAWGQRLGLHKGDYKKSREEELKAFHKEAGKEPPTAEELHTHVWGTWNESMHEYMMLDIDVNYLLYQKIIDMNWSNEATILEHKIHALMVQQERNGFVFNVEHAEKLADHLRGEYDILTADAIQQIGKWYRPSKSVIDNANEAQGENADRRVWGVVDYPKRTASYQKSNAEFLASGEYTNLRADTIAGAPFVKVELKEFNPNSRPQIIDRLQTLYGWEPADFTEAGSPTVDDEVLRTLADKIPLAETLAEVFYIKKRLGQVADGKNGWLKLVREDGRIHGRVNVGGAVTGRATHSSPNMSQVTGVTPVELKGLETGKTFLEQYKEKMDFLKKPIIVSYKYNDRKDEWKFVTRGRTGGYGWDSRSLFTVEPGYKLVGCDLSGVEFRCLANLTFPFDNGEIVDVVLNGDIHQRNADLTGISRGLAKRLLYACLYGGGDSKLGSIIEPFASEARQSTIGKQAREKLMKAMPSLAAALKQIKREKRKNNGTVAGLDGRRLYARSDHSVLNLRLQSDGALIAKKWCLMVDDAFYDEGWDHGVGLEYYFVNWSHDEIEVAVKNGLEQRAAEIMESMAPLVGDYFSFKCPLKAEAKIGMTWAEVH
jgi:hypothetical protein